MAKYHVNPKTNRPNICRARSESTCPLKAQGAEHFDNKDDAQKHAETLLSKKNNIMKSASKNSENSENNENGENTVDFEVDKEFSNAQDFIDSKNFDYIAETVAGIKVDRDKDFEHNYSYLYVDNENNANIAKALANVDLDKQEWEKVKEALKKEISEKSFAQTKTPDAAVNKVLKNLSGINYQDVDNIKRMEDFEKFAQENNLKEVISKEIKLPGKNPEDTSVVGISELDNGLYAVQVRNGMFYNKHFLFKKDDLSTPLGSVRSLDDVAINLTDGLNKKESKQFLDSYTGRKLLLESKNTGLSTRVSYAMDSVTENASKNKGFYVWDKQTRKNIVESASTSMHKMQAVNAIDNIAATAQGKTLAHTSGVLKQEYVQGKSVIRQAQEIDFGMAQGRKVDSATLSSLRGKYEYDYVEDVNESYTEDDVEFIEYESNVNSARTLSRAEKFDKKYHNDSDERIVDVLHNYTTENYREFASVSKKDARRADSYLAESTHKIDKFISEYENNRDIEPRVVYRGARLPKGISDRDAYYDSISVGSVMATTRLTSTTRDASVVGNFSNDINTVYRTNKGIDIADGEISDNANEREVLLRPGSEFVCVEKMKDLDGNITLFFEDIPSKQSKQ